jgi:hypothetical protein
MTSKTMSKTTTVHAIILFPLRNHLFCTMPRKNRFGKDSFRKGFLSGDPHFPQRYATLASCFVRRFRELHCGQRTISTGTTSISIGSFIDSNTAMKVVQIAVPSQSDFLRSSDGRFPLLFRSKLPHHFPKVKRFWPRCTVFTTKNAILILTAK